MSKKLHPKQCALLKLLKKDGFESLSLREIGNLIDVDHPQKVAHHLNRLERKGYLRRNFSTGQLEILENPVGDVVYFPFYGMAQCGPNGLMAEENLVERIPLPTKALGIVSEENMFLVRARGKSMEPRIKENDLILARKQNNADDHSICVVIHNEVPKIKEFFRGDQKTSFLKSFNDNYPLEIIKEGEDELEIVGVVKNIISNL